MAGTSRGHSGSPRQQPRHLAKKRRTSTGDAAREERIQERLASRGNSTDITSDSNLKDEDEEDTDADSDGYTSSEDGAATQSPTRTALQEYRLPPPRSSSRAAPSVENEDFSPTDLDAYHALPLPRVRITTFKFPGEISGRQCVELRHSVEQYLIMNELLYHDIQLHQSRNYRWKTWHLVVTADALHTGAFESVVKDIIQQVRGRKDSA